LSSTVVLVLIAVVCAAAGGAAGWFFGRKLDPLAQRLREAEQRLTAAQAALQDYRRQVTDHFRGTAERVNRLTENYRELHSHLSDGALGLCDTSQPGEEVPLLTSLSGASARGASPASLNPPLDYAPSRAPEGGAKRTDDLDLESLHDD